MILVRLMLVIPDIHHKTNSVDAIRAQHPGLPAIFLGDYFDDFNDTPEDMRATCHWLRSAFDNPEDVFLLGNHCFAYLAAELGVRWGFCSGWTAAKQQVFHQFFPGEMFLKRCRPIVSYDGWLISHAGVSNKLYRTFARRRSLEEILTWAEDAVRALTAGIAHPAFLAGIDRGGSQKTGGILWCDWEQFRPIPGIRQIVGHTPAANVRSRQGNFCLDTHLRHYALLQQGRLHVLNMPEHPDQSA